MSNPRSDLGELLRLAWPIAVAQVGLPLMGLVDIAVVGRVSVADLAGAALGRSIGFSVFMLALGVAMGLEPLASQAIGAREPLRAWGSMRTTILAVSLLWAPLMLAGFLFTFLLEPFGVDHEVVIRTRAYLIGTGPGFLLLAAFATMKIFLQAHGKTRPALVAVFVANVVNVIVCNLLVRGDDVLVVLGMHGVGLPRLGAFGAGLASTVAGVVLVSIVFIAARAYKPEAPAPPIPLRKVLAVGTPIGLQMLAETAVFALVALIAGTLGKEIVSAHQVAIGVASTTYNGALGVAGATAVCVGRAVGAGTRPRRVGLLGITVGGVMMAIPALVFMIIPRTLASLFTHDETVIALGIGLLRIAGVFQLFDGVQAVAGGALRGAGDVRYSFVVNVVSYWVIGLPIALVLCFPFGMGARGLWWGLTLGLILASIALTLRFVRLSRSTVARIG